MLVELSPVAYLTLCSLVRDALEVESDAAPLLQRVSKELAGSANELASDLEDQPERVEALRRGGYLAG